MLVLRLNQPGIMKLIACLCLSGVVYSTPAAGAGMFLKHPVHTPGSIGSAPAPHSGISRPVSVSRVSPAALVLTTGKKERTITVYGHNLERITSARLMLHGHSVRNVRIRLGRAAFGSRRVFLKAGKEAAASRDYQIYFSTGQGDIPVPSRIVVENVHGVRYLPNSQPGHIQTRIVPMKSNPPLQTGQKLPPVSKHQAGDRIEPSKTGDKHRFTRNRSSRFMFPGARIIPSVPKHIPELVPTPPGAEIVDAAALPRMVAFNLSRSEVKSGESVEASIRFNKPAVAGMSILVSTNHKNLVPNKEIRLSEGEKEATTILGVQRNEQLHAWERIRVAADCLGELRRKDGTINKQWDCGHFTSNLNVAPPAQPSLALASVRLDKSEAVAGDRNITGAVQLTEVPIGSLSIKLFSSNPAVVRVPKDVFFPGGSSKATFKAHAGEVTEDTRVQIQAVYGGVSRQVGLTVMSPPHLARFTLSEHQVTEGEPIQATVTIDRQAVINTTVKFYSNNGKIVPAQPLLTIPVAGRQVRYSIYTNRDSVDPRSGKVNVGIRAACMEGCLGESQEQPVTVFPLTHLFSLSYIGADKDKTGEGHIFHADTTHRGVISGNFFTANLFFNRPSPQSGVAVKLIASTPEVETPGEIFVSEGKLSIPITVKSKPTRKKKLFCLAAMEGKWSVQDCLDLFPRPRLESLSVGEMATSNETFPPKNGKYVGGITRVMGRIYMSERADGEEISLASSNPELVQVPDHIRIPARSQAVVFSIRTFSVNAPSSVTIKAEYDGNVRTASLTLSPP